MDTQIPSVMKSMESKELLIAHALPDFARAATLANGASRIGIKKIARVGLRIALPVKQIDVSIGLLCSRQHNGQLINLGD
jgi:hypothetical protein